MAMEALMKSDLVDVAVVEQSGTLEYLSGV
jgi:hypothetical protein